MILRKIAFTLVLILISSFVATSIAAPKKKAKRRPRPEPPYAALYWEQHALEAKMYDDLGLDRPIPIDPASPEAQDITARSQAYCDEMEAKYPIDPEVKARAKAWTVVVEPNGDLHAVPYVDE